MSKQPTMVPDPTHTPESNYWSTIHSFLPDAGISSFNSLRTFINAPMTPKSFAIIAENLLEILPLVLSSIDSVHESELARNIPLWIEYCREIVNKQEEIASVIPGFRDSGDLPYKPPQLGDYTRHPLGVALWCSVKTAHEPSSSYRLLQANLCLAHHFLIQLEETRKYRYANAKEVGCRTTRQLADPKYYSSLNLLPETAIRFTLYCRAVIDLAEDPRIRNLKPLFAYALHRKRGITHDRRKDPYDTSPFEKIVPTMELTEEEGHGAAEKISVLKVRSGNRGQAARQKKYLCSPEEFTDARETVLIEHSGSDPSGGLSIGQQYFKARGVTTAIEMHNQRLGCDWENLTPYEISVLLDGIEKLAGQGENISGIPAAEVAAFLSIIFWTSATPEVACRSVWVPQPAASKEQLAIHWEGATRFWVVEPKTPKQKHIPAHRLKDQALPLSSRYVLPIPAVAQSVLRQRLEKLAGNMGAVRLFSRSSSTLVTAADMYMKSLRKATGGRHTLQRVSRFVHDFLSRMPGSDVTVAMAVTGREDILGSVALHYTAHPVRRVQELYAAACARIQKDSGIERCVFGGENSQIPGTDNVYVGSMYVPLRTTVITMIEDLHARLEDARGKTKMMKEGVLKLHNVLTVYTVMMLGFATGYRAVRDPLLQEAEIDRATGFAAISDKDDDSFRHSRIVWLPEMCIRQIDLFREHTDQLQKLLFTENQDLFFKVRRKATTGRGENRENPSLYLLDTETGDLTVKPKYLEGLLKIIDYQLPMNANRHYLRTNLFERNCPVEVINAFMGHADRGNDPWGVFSGLSPLVYRQALTDCLVPILKEDGWRVESGLKAGGKV